MTPAGSTTTFERPSDDRRALAAVAGLEARRFLRSVPWWIGLGLSLLMWAMADLRTENWLGAKYHELVGIAPFTTYTGAFISGALVGMRDRRKDVTSLATATPVSAPTRFTGRLLGGYSLVAIAVISLVIGYGYLRVAGGITVGGARVMPKGPDLVLIVALVAFAVSSGVAAGRLCGSRSGVLVGGSIAIFLTTASNWIFGPLVDFLPTGGFSPRDVNLGADYDPSTAPLDWMLETPRLESGIWQTKGYEQAAVSWHVVYVVGLTLLAAALARRSDGANRTPSVLAIAGAAAVAVGGIVQLLVRSGTYVA